MRHVNAEKRLEEWSAEAEEMKLEKMADDFIKLGKRNMGDSDSEALNEDDSDEEEEEKDNAKSVVIDNGSNSESSREAEASSGSITCGRLNAGSLGRESLEKHIDHSEVVSEVPNKSYSSKVDKIVSQQPGISGAENKAAERKVENSCMHEAVQEESVSATENLQNLDNPINFDEYNSAAE
ncbi:PREDICTED: uncharacterized protein LOC105964006 [Erythranthe guttata]|uniref:uncharacterized protein LOC105964006 n=1 Tax=Erythranthe guttata TaxID=4155 RepID=UPI00064E0E56|nr:PREDICTED: uncharacterized protein LOC105964006 [Erythranthe guttata]|eukprot:XP_012843958.1 PREDICTED: uncharacterized protein LOC105964006 [Erythranthe guttata]